MDHKKARATLDQVSKVFDKVVEPDVRAAIAALLNLVEILLDEDEKNKRKIRKLEDEIKRLKGEQGRPKIRPQKKTGAGDNHSSEKDRKQRAKRKNKKPKTSKKNKVKVDREQLCQVALEQLPKDAVRKGYKTTVIQDLKFTTDNIEFKREVYYSPSLKKTFIAPLPEGYSGEYGPGIRTLVLSLYHNSNMTEPALMDFFKLCGVFISKATISRMLTDKHDFFHQEKEDIVNAGLQSSYQQVDDTSARVNGKNHYVHILCNPLYTAYFTRPKKERLTLLEILCHGELKFSLNQESFQLMKAMGLSEKRFQQMVGLDKQGTFSRKEIDAILLELFSKPHKHQANRRIILEASALVYYHHLDHAIKHLMCDDAPQFNRIAQYKSLCWIHEGRHYKKLRPLVPQHRKHLDAFTNKFWDFYQSLLDYTASPTADVAEQLRQEFDVIFSTQTGYDLLDARIAFTMDKKKSLLLPLEFSFLPLHNNDAEGGAQHQARLRDIHLQTKNEKGTKAKDTFATIVKTARKLNVNVFDYFYDRVAKIFSMPSLAELILERCAAPGNTS